MEHNRQATNVLIVEDDPDIQQSLAEILGMEGFSTSVAQVNASPMFRGCTVRSLTKPFALPDLLALFVLEGPRGG